jgi:2-(1,2-epoxy-1,2-dihydrophenyl)acetyl-CoA isomerase
MGDLEIERLGAVTVMRINRPERRNAIGGTLLRELVEAFEAAEGDDEVRVVVTTGVGPTYCVGADLGELLDHLGAPTREMLNGTSVGGDKGAPPLSPDQQLLERLGVGRWSQRMAACTKPSIAALNGATAGGGLALAVAQDFRVASADIAIRAGFLGVGVGPELGLSYLLPRLTGWPAARNILLRNRVVRAEEALRCGLIDEVAPAGAALDRALALAGELADQPAVAMRATNRLLRDSADNSWREQLEAEYRTQLLLFGLPATRAALEKLAGEVVGRADNDGAVS